MNKLTCSQLLADIPFRSDEGSQLPRRSRRSFLEAYRDEIDRFCLLRANNPSDLRYSIRQLSRFIEKKEQGKHKVSHSTVSRFLKKIGQLEIWSEA